MSDDRVTPRPGLYQEARKAWADLGRLLEEFARETGVKLCPACKNVVPEGKHHRPFNGNQMFACQEYDGPPPDYSSRQTTTTATP